MAGSTTTGRRLGRYHLGAPLGGGPCGSVYRAKVYGVAGFERQFAVKRFHPELVALPVVSQRLSAAARAYGSLEHPRIARLHEYGVAGGEVFTATEMVSGLDVMRLVGATHGVGQPLPPGAALALVTQAARAIGYAHGRGVNHLGLCPTNVVVTPDGDVKITDFGIIAQTLTIRPSDDSRLALRIHYLAPEQLVGEAASAASDVFSLGALVHELLTGERAFVGVTSLDVEHAILSGHVRDAGLPKAVARVLARCFARSPYERFPDARALADAFDAALRISPVVGGRRELGGIVKDAVARIEAMNEGQLSGAMVLAMPMMPSPAQTMQLRGAVPPVPPMPSLAPKRPGSRGTDQVTAIRETNVGAAPVRLPSAPPGSLSVGPPTMRGRHSPPTRPPPITPPALIQRGAIAKTMPPPIPGAIPTARIDEDSDERTMSRDPVAPHMSPTPGMAPMPMQRAPNASPPPFHAANGEPEQELGEQIDPPLRLRLDSAWETSERAAIPDGAQPLDNYRPSETLIEIIDNDSEGVPVLPGELAALHDQSLSSLRGAAPPAASAPLAALAPDTASLPAIGAGTGASLARSKPRSKARGWLIALFLLVCAGVGVGAVVVWNRLMPAKSDGQAEAAGAVSDGGGSAVETVVPDKRVVTRPAKDAGAGTGGAIKSTRVPDGGVAARTVDAGAAQVKVPPDPVRGGEVADGIKSAVGVTIEKLGGTVPPPVDAGVAQVVEDPTPAPDGMLVIESTPAGARVFVDGAEQGETPARLRASSDRHTLALFLPGHALYTAEIDGKGTHKATLIAVTPSGGSAGIKLKCKKKERYYVVVDGHDTGQLCPTERIGVEKGKHVVETYDLVTEERKQWNVNVKQTRLSARIKVDY